MLIRILIYLLMALLWVHMHWPAWTFLLTALGIMALGLWAERILYERT